MYTCAISEHLYPHMCAPAAAAAAALTDRPTVRATSKEDSSEMDTRQNEMKLRLCLCQVGLSWSVGASLIHRFHWHKHMHAIILWRDNETLA